MRQGKNVPVTVDAYLARFPAKTRRLLQKLRRAIHDVSPGIEESISYGIPAFSLGKRRVHLAAYEGHLGFYPGAEPLEVFAEELSGFELGKGTVRLPIDTPLPVDLVRRMVRFRLGLG